MALCPQLGNYAAQPLAALGSSPPSGLQNNLAQDVAAISTPGRGAAGGPGSAVRRPPRRRKRPRGAPRWPVAPRPLAAAPRAPSPASAPSPRSPPCKRRFMNLKGIRQLSWKFPNWQARLVSLPPHQLPCLAHHPAMIRSRNIRYPSSEPSSLDRQAMLSRVIDSMAASTGLQQLGRTRTVNAGEEAAVRRAIQKRS